MKIVQCVFRTCVFVSTVYNIYIRHNTLYIVQCTLYNVQFTLYIVHCTLYNVHCVLYIICTICRLAGVDASPPFDHPSGLHFSGDQSAWAATNNFVYLWDRGLKLRLPDKERSRCRGWSPFRCTLCCLCQLVLMAWTWSHLVLGRQKMSAEKNG